MLMPCLLVSYFYIVRTKYVHYVDTLGNKEEIQAHVEVCEALGKEVAQSMVFLL